MPQEIATVMALPSKLSPPEIKGRIKGLLAIISSLSLNKGLFPMGGSFDGGSFDRISIYSQYDCMSK